MEAILKHLQPYANLEGTTRKDITITLGKLGITQAAHIWDNTSNTWKSFEAKMDQTRGIFAEIKEWTIWLIYDLQEANLVAIEKDRDLDLWIRANNISINGTFMLTNKKTYLMTITKTEEWKGLNTIWNKQDTEEKWTLQWKTLWGLDLTIGPKYFYGKS